MKIYIKAYRDWDIVDMEKAFALLNDKLAEANKDLTILCAGGFALRYYNIRASNDIDAFYKSDPKIDKIIKEVGDILNINEKETWLNNALQNCNATPNKRYFTKIYDYSNLQIYVIDLMYLFGMKMEAGREKDYEDCAKIIKSEGFTDIVDLYDDIAYMNFTVNPLRYITVFALAYGADFVEEYKKKNKRKYDDLMNPFIEINKMS